jgi:hypothetical protein
MAAYYLARCRVEPGQVTAVVEAFQYVVGSAFDHAAARSRDLLQAVLAGAGRETDAWSLMRYLEDSTILWTRDPISAFFDPMEGVVHICRYSLSGAGRLTSVTERDREESFDRILTLEMHMIKKTLGVAALGVALMGAPAIAATAEAGTTTAVTTSTSAQSQAQAKDCWWSHGRWKCDRWGNNWKHRNHWNDWGHRNHWNNWGHKNWGHNNWGHKNWGHRNWGHNNWGHNNWGRNNWGHNNW